MTIECRYHRWRVAIRLPVWAIDRHWYGMLGALYEFHESERRGFFWVMTTRGLA